MARPPQTYEHFDTSDKYIEFLTIFHQIKPLPRTRFSPNEVIQVILQRVGKNDAKQTDS